SAAESILDPTTLRKSMKRLEAVTGSISHRGREILRAPCFVGLGAHDKLQFATRGQFLVRDPRTIERLAIEGRRLDVDVLGAVLLGDDDKGLRIVLRTDLDAG